MLKDHYYDILSQLVTEQRSLWRIQKYYLKNSRGCKTCQKFFKKLAEDKQNHIKEILNLLSRHKLNS
jgi:hypothetical protein